MTRSAVPGPRRLVVTADDFGLSSRVDDGILKAFHHGVVRSTALLVNFPDLPESLARLQQAPQLEVGVHLNLTSGPPVLPPARVASLVGRQGQFHDFSAFFSRVALGRIHWDEVFDEWNAQIERGLELGCRFTFLTGHQHVHMLPAAARVCARLAKAHCIPVARLAKFHVPEMLWPFRPKALALALFVPSARGIFQGAGLLTNDSILEIALGKPEVTLNRLSAMLRSLTPGVHELVCHPGYLDTTLEARDRYVRGRLLELEVLTDPAVQACIKSAGIELNTYESALQTAGQHRRHPASQVAPVLSSAASPNDAPSSWNVRLATAADTQPCDEYVAAHPDSFFCHTMAWRRVIESAYRHRSFYLTAWQGAALCGVLPLFLIESRLFGRILASGVFASAGAVCADRADVAAALVDRAVHLAEEHRAQYLELKSLHRNLNEVLIRDDSYSNFALPLDALETLWRRSLDQDTRAAVRQAERYGLTASDGHQLLPQFYGLMAESMRRLGTPVHSLRFYQNILEFFGSRAQIVLVWKGPQAIAGAILVRHRDSVSLLQTGSLAPYLRLRPNNLLYWEVIKRSVAQGAASLDMGRSLVGSGNAKFKESWGATPQPLYYEYFLARRKALPQINQSNPRFAAARWVWQRIPLPLTKWLGPGLIRSIP